MNYDELVDRFEDVISNGTAVDYSDRNNSLRVLFDNGDRIEYYPNEVEE